VPGLLMISDHCFSCKTHLAEEEFTRLCDVLVESVNTPRTDHWLQFESLEAQKRFVAGRTQLVRRSGGRMTISALQYRTNMPQSP
jgi:hypothetical protein